MDINGTSAIVTGGASGLGAATAQALAKRGATVYAFDLPTAIEVATPPDGVQLVAVDVADAAQVAAAVRAVAQGPSVLRLVVNCAGIAPAARLVGRHGVHDPALFARVVQVNLIGTFHVMAYAAEQMAAQKPCTDGQRGVVVNTASIAAFDGQAGQAAYSASKGGVVAMGLAVARDLARHGIRVVTIAPGLMETPMVAELDPETIASLSTAVPFPRRLGRPEEFADLVTTVVEHDYLNGEVIRMDGALRMA